ncbi:MAG TPA: Hpt domain-containing protein [Gemmatimonadaceae bacterium]
MQEALIDDDILDEAQLMHIADGDRTLVRELAVALLNELPRHLGAIRSAVGQANAPALKAAAHALKGAAATLAASRVAGIAGQLELTEVSDAWAGAVTILAKLEPAISELQSRLIALTGGPS